jgi:hypothetical protein
MAFLLSKIPLYSSDESIKIQSSEELHNSKIFPFATYSQVNYCEYQDLLGGIAVFNATYHAHCFDFLGDSLVSCLVQFRFSVSRIILKGAIDAETF